MSTAEPICLKKFIFDIRIIYGIVSGKDSAVDQGEELGDQQLGGLGELACGLLAVSAEDEVALSEAFGWKEEELFLFQLFDKIAEPTCELELSLLQDPYSHRRSDV